MGGCDQGLIQGMPLAAGLSAGGVGRLEGSSGLGAGGDGLVESYLLAPAQCWNKNIMSQQKNCKASGKEGGQ